MNVDDLLVWYFSHTSRPFPAASRSGRLPGDVTERPIRDASDRAQRATVGGRVGCRQAPMPGLFRAVVALGVRALARDPHARWSAVAEATASVVRRVRHHARAVPGVVGAASARQRRGDRRSAALGRRRGWAPPDRPAAGPAARDRPRVAASGTPARPGASRVREPAAGGAGRAGGCGHAGRQRAGRRCRGDDAGGPSVQAAVRSCRPGGGGSARCG